MNTRIIKTLYYYPSKNIFVDLQSNIEYDIVRLLGSRNIEMFKINKKTQVISVKSKKMLPPTFPSYIASKIFGVDYIQIIYCGGL